MTQTDDLFCKLGRTDELQGGRYSNFVRISGENRNAGGCVYTASTKRPLDRTVAIKEIQRQDIFLNELNILRGIKHTSVPFLIDAFHERGYHYLVMEYINGDTLEDKMKQRVKRPLRVAEVLDWAIDLLEVLEYLHRPPKRYVHRDIKPANIKIRYDDNRAVLLDFGIAKEGDVTKIPYSFTEAWAAPEQVASSSMDRSPAMPSKTEFRSDLYSFAATFYYLLTGDAPARARERIKQTQPQQLIHILDFNLQPDVPADVAQIIMSALELDLNKRPPSARKMREELLIARRKLPLAPSEGEVVGEHYRLGRPIEQGELGDVFHAHDERSSSPVTMRYISHDIANNMPDVLQRLRQFSQMNQAAQASAGRHAPNSVAYVAEMIDEVSEEVNYPGVYAVFEPLVGPLLSSYLDREPYPDPLKTLCWLDQALKALAHLHGRTPRIVLASLSPSSIEVRDNDTLKLRYWGPLYSNNRRLSAERKFFIPPELRESDWNVATEPHEDLYALAATFHVLLGGQDSIEEDERTLVWDTESWSDPQSSPYSADIHPLFGEVLSQAMAHEPARRYHQAEAMRSALEPLNRLYELRKLLEAHEHGDKVIVTLNNKVEPVVREEYRGFARPHGGETRSYPVVLNLLRDLIEALTCIHDVERPPGGVMSISAIWTDAAGNARLLHDIDRPAQADWNDANILVPQCYHQLGSPARDVSVLSAIAYQLLTGRKPPRADTRQGMVDDEEGDPLKEIPGIPKLLNKVIYNGLALAPEKPYANAWELYDALRPLYEVQRLQTILAEHVAAGKLWVYADELGESSETLSFGPLRNRWPAETDLGTKAVKIVNDVAEALSCLHNLAEQPHGAIGPDTIWVDAQMNARLLYQVDWDTARDFDETFAAPERLKNRPTLISDLFSLAAIAYFLLTGYEPPRQKIAAGPDKFQSRIANDLRGLAPKSMFGRSKGLERTTALLARAMAFLPGQRAPKSRADFVDQFGRALRADGVLR
jgi:serine/threonine protein kinase